MLVLTRKLNDVVLIKVPGRKEPIKVFLCEIKSFNSAKLGFQADADIEIVRAELLDNEHCNQRSK